MRSGADSPRNRSEEPEEPYLGYLIKLIDMDCERQVNNLLRQKGLTRSQAFMLHNIERRGGSATLKELESEAGVAQSTAWGVSKRLEDKGFLSLSVDPHDSRAKVATLTDAGRAACAEAWGYAMGLEARFQHAFTSKERHQLVAYLERMLQIGES